LLYLTGHHNPAVAEASKTYPLGLELQPGNRSQRWIPDYPRGWAADNGCFAKGKTFDLGKFFDWLELLRPFAASCLFASTPDVLGDARATIARSLPVFDEIRQRGYKPAFVGQDGLQDEPIPWGLFDCFFIGGSTEWKLGPEAAAIAREAKARGKWVHMGRVNSRRRLLYAESIGCDSTDGTFLKFGPDKNLPRLLAWFK
jgi:hypothetical protein